MDPNACVAQVMAHLAAGEYNEAREAIDALQAWTDGGGFAPEWSRVMATLSA